MINAIEGSAAGASIAPSHLDYLAVAGGPGSLQDCEVGGDRVRFGAGLAEADYHGANPMLERMFFVEQDRSR